MSIFTLESYMSTVYGTENTKPMDPIDLALECYSAPKIEARLQNDPTADILIDMSLVLEEYQSRELDAETLAEMNQRLLPIHKDFSQAVTADNYQTLVQNINMGILDSVKGFFNGISEDIKHWKVKNKAGYDGLKAVLDRIPEMGNYSTDVKTITLKKGSEGITTSAGKLGDMNAIRRFFASFPAVSVSYQSWLMALAEKNQATVKYSPFADCAAKLGLIEVFSEKDRDLEVKAYGVYKDSYFRTFVELPDTVIEKTTVLKTAKPAEGAEFPVLSLRDLEKEIKFILDTWAKFDLTIDRTHRLIQDNLKKLDDIAKGDLAKARNILKLLRLGDSMVSSCYRFFHWGTADLANAYLATFKLYKRGASKEE